MNGKWRLIWSFMSSQKIDSAGLYRKTYRALTYFHAKLRNVFWKMSEKEADILDSKKPFKATKIWNELITHLRANLEQKKRRYKMRLYDECFTGVDAINVLQPYIEKHPDFHRSPSRDKVKNLCQLLLDNQVFNSVVMVDAKKDYFEGNKLYRFVDYDCDISENIDTSNCLEPDSKRCKIESETAKVLASSEVIQITKEVAICRLCQIVDIPFLEEILEEQHSQSTTSNSFAVIPDEHGVLSPRTSLLQKTLNDRANNNDKIWLEAAKGCFHVQRHFPLPQKKEVGFLNIASHSRLGIFHSFSGFYNSLLEPLIPIHLACILCAIAEANLQNGSKRTAEALQLLMMLVPLERLKHLRELLVFMKTTVLCELDLECDVDLNAAVYQAFKMAIFPVKVTQVEGSEQLLFFMMDNAHTIFMTPDSFDKLVKEHITSLQEGLDCLPALTACQQMSTEEYNKQRVDETNRALEELINTIMDDLKMSLKEKKQKLKIFQKHHPQVFRNCFPEGVL